jgi:isopenicillin-N epimerase
LTGAEPLSPVPDPEGFPWFVQMVACPLPPVDAKLLKRRMYDEDRVEVPVTTHGDHAFIRLSFQGYNTDADLEAALASLARWLPEVVVG